MLDWPNPNWSNRRSAVQWYFPLWSKWVFSASSHTKELHGQTKLSWVSGCEGNQIWLSIGIFRKSTVITFLAVNLFGSSGWCMHWQQCDQKKNWKIENDFKSKIICLKNWTNESFLIEITFSIWKWKSILMSKATQSLTIRCFDNLCCTLGILYLTNLPT